MSYVPLIAIESIDSVGKDTLINLIKEKNPEFNFIQFPNEQTVSGQLTRKILSGEIDLPDLVLQHAFIVNFYEMFSTLVYFRSSPDETLILNRYFLSTLAYSYAQNLDVINILNVLQYLPLPDYFILLEGERRGQSVGDKHDVDDALQAKTLEGFRRFIVVYDHAIIHNNSTPEIMLDKFSKIFEDKFS